MVKTTSIIKNTVIVLLAVLPILINPWGFDVFALPRVFCLYFLALFLLGFFLYHQYQNKKLEIKYTNLHLYLGIFLIFIILSTILAKDKQTALWGFVFDYEGLFSWLAYLLLFYLGYLYFTSKVILKKFAIVISFIVLGVSIYALLQYFFDWQILDWAQKSEIKRAFSFLGQPNYLGAYYLLTLPLIWFLIKSSGYNFWLQIIARLSFILGFIGLILTFSRASWLAFAVIAVLYLIINYKKATKSIKKHKIVSLIVLILIILAIVITSLTTNLQIVDTITQRAGSITNPESASTLVRVLLYQQSFELLKDHWLIGIGADNYAYIISQYFKPAWNLYEQATADKAHNQILDYWISFGIFGLAAYLIFLIIWLKKYFQFLIKKITSDREVVSLLGLSVIAYLIFVQLNFSTIDLAPFFWLYLGITTALLVKNNLLQEKTLVILKNEKTLNIISKIAYLIFLLLIIVLIYTGYQKISADYNFVEAFKNEALEDTVKQLEKTVRKNPYRVNYYLALNDHLITQGQVTNNFATFDQAIDSLEEAKEKIPYSYRIDYQLGETFLQVVQYAQNKDFVYNQAKTAYESVLQKYPNHLQAHIKLGVIWANLGDKNNAERYWLKCLELDKTQYQCAYNLSILYEQIGDTDKASQYKEQYEQYKR